MSPAKLQSLSATAIAARNALIRFKDAARAVWPDVPDINSMLARALCDVSVWAEKGGKGDPVLKGLRGLFLDPIVRVEAPPSLPPLHEAAITAVMSKLGTKGGASKSERKIAAAKATLSKVNSERALKRAKSKTLLG